MHMILRTLLVLRLGRRRSRLQLHDVGRLRLRVWPSDLDVLRHVNNGVYLSMMDLGRLDLMVRCGLWARFTELGIYPVVASQTISYRKSLNPWQRFEIETRMAGYDERAAYVEQRFVRGGEIYARAFVKARFLRRAGGPVPIAELAEVAGIDLAAYPPAEWIARWAADVALPSTRAAAPSEWADLSSAE